MITLSAPERGSAWRWRGNERREEVEGRGTSARVELTRVRDFPGLFVAFMLAIVPFL